MEFMLGCNYWASNAGTEMWRDFDTDAIESDFKRYAEYGLKYLRVFPNWRDFQPIQPFYTASNTLREFRNEKGELFDNPYYLDMQMIERFRTFCRIADKYGMKLIVGIVTGWMSGRMFTPPILYGRNLICDHLSLNLLAKYVKGFVKELECENAIFAWDLGNECNGLSPVENEQQAELWTALISNTIRSFDTHNRPVVSGMHGIGVDSNWTIFAQGENTDIVTTHPYPHYVPHCYSDGMSSYRAMLHATCESVYYESLSGKSCLAEEIGTLGPCTCDEEVAANFLRANLYSNWANGILGVLWWCGNEQVELKTPPYSWNMMERELGLSDINGRIRPIMKEYKAFADFLAAFNDDLPKIKSDGVAIVTKGQDTWGIGYMTYMLAKQAGLNLTFSSYKSDIPESDFYLLPSINGTESLSMEKFDLLTKRVYEGATLYISNDIGYIARFEEITGVHIKTTVKTNLQTTFTLDGEKHRVSRSKWAVIESADAIAFEEDGSCIFTKHQYGKGTIYFLNFPLEAMLLDTDNFENEDHYKIYKHIFADKLKKKIATKDNKFIGITVHEKEDSAYCVLINYSQYEQKTGLSIKEGYSIEKVICGNPEILSPCESCVLLLKKN